MPPLILISCIFEPVLLSAQRKEYKYQYKKVKGSKVLRRVPKMYNCAKGREEE